MTHEKSKGDSNEGTSIPIVLVISTIFVWCTGLSINAYVLNGSVSGLTASVSDIKENTANVPTLKAEVDWLVAQRGYIITPAATTSLTTYNN